MNELKRILENTDAKIFILLGCDMFAEKIVTEEKRQLIFNKFIEINRSEEVVEKSTPTGLDIADEIISCRYIYRKERSEKILSLELKNIRSIEGIFCRAQYLYNPYSILMRWIDLPI